MRGRADGGSEAGLRMFVEEQRTGLLSTPLERSLCRCLEACQDVPLRREMCARRSRVQKYFTVDLPLEDDSDLRVSVLHSHVAGGGSPDRSGMRSLPGKVTAITAG